MIAIIQLIFSTVLHAPFTLGADLCISARLTDDPKVTAGTSCVCTEGLRILSAKPNSAGDLKIRAQTPDLVISSQFVIPAGVLSAHEKDPVTFADVLLNDRRLQFCCVYTFRGSTCVDIKLKKI